MTNIFSLRQNPPAAERDPSRSRFEADSDTGAGAGPSPGPGRSAGVSTSTSAGRLAGTGLGTDTRPLPTTSAYDAHRFDALYAADRDPWGLGSRWYEARKRALTIAALPVARYRSGYEPCCATGELSAMLAERCDRLLCTDGAMRAVRQTAERLAGARHVDVRQAWLPEQWPDGRFDLIVLSEFLYYLGPQQLAPLVDCVQRSLAHDGVVLACHWRHPIAGCALDGDAVHGRLDALLQLARPTSLVDADFRLDLWSRDPRSVAARTGLC